MKFTLFHLMPYAALDLEATRRYPTAWLLTPNSHYDPEQGAQLYQRYLGELELGEELGFDGIAVNEHHSTAYGLMPSPIVMASALARSTRRVKIAILGSAIPLRDHPLTLAEEHAMIDTICRGRLITGLVRGIGAEYHAWGVNPVFSHERFHEAHDLIVAAWTRPGPFRWSSKHYHFEYVNPWPRPYQTPHPPIWIPSQGSTETIEWAAHPQRRYTYLQTFSPIKSVRKYLQQYRETAERYGYTAADDALGWAVPIFVGATDAEAHRDAKLHFENFRNRFLKMPLEMLLPPGYTSVESMRGIEKSKAQITGDITLEIALDMGMVFCGAPQTVREQLLAAWQDMRFGHLLAMLQFGTLPAELTGRNMRLFASEVMPWLRERTATAKAH
ncbi:MAG: LLM class flavin-dependent oxidoreductase [Steroidobacteraceae bacterium]|nr:LLM class flavin-dependent oxidoreductase [Steroidobacteraceae bacterium]MDW8259001.1 LLM class flavin-dependent oxidoreductase [Gammaproteobacteria bacterium]